ncbi:triple tyrosine motif-containing protein [Microscilla marina]|uniref:Two component regulator three Y motif family n=1 Tax=Microscilla marina ATCC 23134 TaxID=313606 RepID=A1ZRZ2_MICM2|nr:triple tyrosine motif-containing protein [Microscilla marina]EAY26880.1 Two component regulator three Y motif family [Microscilla marina ATCC 23134]
MNPTPIYLNFYRFYTTLFALLWLVTGYTLQAQHGDLYLTNYKVPIKNVDHQNRAIAQGTNNVMYFANTKGVLSYDGVVWGMIPTRNTPYSLSIKIKYDNIVYVGCRNNFGYLTRDKLGRETYKSISDRKANLKVLGRIFGEVNRIVQKKKHIYFYSHKALIKVNRKTLNIEKVWFTHKERQFAGILFLNDTPYIQIKAKGLHRIAGDKLIPIGSSKMYAYLDIHDSFMYNNEQALFIASNSWSYLFDGKKIKLYIPRDYKYLLSNLMRGALRVGNKDIAFSTLSGGVLVAEQNYGKTKRIINYQTGLPDDEVLAMYKDRLGALWICHSYGITRADARLPVKSYSSYAGIDGNVTSSLKRGDSLFVSTSEGVFYLNKVSRFEQVASLIKKEAKYLRTIKKTERVVTITEPKDRRETKLRIYRHSEEGEKDVKRKIEVKETSKTEETPSRVISYEKSSIRLPNEDIRKIYAMASIPYIYKKVTGLHAKCRQMYPYGKGMLIASNIGLYAAFTEKDEVAASPVIKDEYVHFIYQSPSNKNWFYIGTEHGLHFVVYKNGRFKTQSTLQDMTDLVYSIVEHSNGLWLGSENQVLRVNLDPKTGMFNSFKRFPFANSYSENIAARLIDGEPAFFLSSGIYSYDAKKKRLIQKTALQKYANTETKVLYHQPGYTWVETKNLWTNITNTKAGKFRLAQFLELFDDVQDIYIDKVKNIWVVNNNELFKIDAQAKLDDRKYFKVFIKNVRNKKGKFLPLKDLVVKHTDNTLSFTFQLASPFFRNEDNTVYQYWLEDLEDRSKKKKKVDWSAWNKRAIISFPFLPSGQYKLHVRAKNTFGQTSQDQAFVFQVKPPFWQTSWFYASQTLFFLGLLLLSLLFSRKGTKYARVSYVLTFVTIITFFEFIMLTFEPYVDNASNNVPVFKLGMNILLALSLAPIEMLLRRMILKKKESSREAAKRVAERKADKQKPTSRSE